MAAPALFDTNVETCYFLFDFPRFSNALIFQKRLYICVWGDP